jgi:dienelactone hydrolase
MMSRTVTVETAGGERSAHVARPVGSPAAAVIALHEIFGVNDDNRPACRALAEQGFIAIAGLPCAVVYSYPGRSHAFAHPGPDRP